MNTKRVSFGLAVLISGSLLFGAINLEKADALYEQDAFAQTQTELQKQLKTASTAEEEAQVLWRLARVMVGLGDDLKDDDKAGKFAMYEQGEAYALQSIEKYPMAMGYQWKASNIGRWGQTKGPLNALGKAKGMLEDLTQIVNSFNTLDSTDTWYVLSSLYDELPGGFISFGNKDWAVSYMRMAMDTLRSDQFKPGHYKKLAEELYARNWNASKRSKELKKMEQDWNQASSNLEKYRYYEGKDGGKSKPFYSPVTLDKMSDRQEAVMVLTYALQKEKVFKPIKPSDAEDLSDIKQLLDDWT
ncbi:MAG: hypothetical protein AB7C91_05585 [Sphaerochaeta sp.]|uniref:hypothetical protein n=1 Tax=Sphaerochaeta sp. TaxID=1972642 RepID=UPI002FC69AB1